jgi:hypothetical protein
MANLTKRHIINVNFANITTATQLKNLFFNEKLTVYSDSTMSNFDVLTIPVENRIFVLEEIDAIGDIVRQRDPNKVANETVPDELTLAEILTVLDGTLEAPGRIVIMTSNYPDVLDRALVRPGRIDVAVKFGFAARDLIQEMFHSFFNRDFSPEMIPSLPDKKLTAAEVGQILFRHFKDPDPQLVLEDLIKTVEAREVLPPSPLVTPPTTPVKEEPSFTKAFDDDVKKLTPEEEFDDMKKLTSGRSGLPNPPFMEEPAKDWNAPDVDEDDGGFAQF